MIRRRLLAARESEQGAALILAIGFILMVGAISAGLLSYLTTSVGHRSSLDAIRNRQYAADGAVEFAIAQVRGVAATADQPSCLPIKKTINNVPIRVECLNANTQVFVPSLGHFVNQVNVIFTSCVDVNVPCTPATTIVRAQVNFSISSANTVDGTTIQAWSVNQ